MNPHKDDLDYQRGLFVTPKDWFVEMVCAVVVAVIGWITVLAMLCV